MKQLEQEKKKKKENNIKFSLYKFFSLAATQTSKTFQALVREFPGGPVVWTQCFHLQGPGVQSLVGELTTCKLCSTVTDK